MQRAILLFGYPGSGKGTQGKILSALPGFHHVAMGDILRALTPANPLFERVQSYLRAGNLVPDELAMDLLKRYVDELKPDPDDFLIIDGVPRNAKQVELLNKIVEVIRIFKLSVYDENLVDRSHAQAGPGPGPVGRRSRTTSSPAGCGLPGGDRVLHPHLSRHHPHPHPRQPADLRCPLRHHSRAGQDAGHPLQVIQPFPSVAPPKGDTRMSRLRGLLPSARSRCSPAAYNVTYIAKTRTPSAVIHEQKLNFFVFGLVGGR